MLAVREIHQEGSARPVRCIVALSTRAGSPCETTLLDGHDFFGTPRPHPGGDRLAVVAWDHPDMPWDASTVLLLPLGRVACAVHDRPTLCRLRGRRSTWPAAGRSRWASRTGVGTGHCASSRTGGLVAAVPSTAGRLGDDGGATRPSTAVEAEFHGPDWVLSQQTMAEMADGALVARMTAAGRDALVAVGS